MRVWKKQETYNAWDVICYRYRSNNLSSTLYYSSDRKKYYIQVNIFLSSELVKKWFKRDNDWYFFFDTIDDVKVFIDAVFDNTEEFITRASIVWLWESLDLKWVYNDRDKVIHNRKTYYYFSWDLFPKDMVVETKDRWLYPKNWCTKTLDTKNYFVSVGWLFRYSHWYKEILPEWAIKMVTWYYVDSSKWCVQLWNWEWCYEWDAEFDEEDNCYYYIDDDYLLDWYHDNDDEWFAKWDIRVWIELEKARMPARSAIAKARDKGWRCEDDWSVNGGEYITPVLDLDKAVEFCKESEKLFTTWEVDETCWWHIHLSIKNETTAKTYEKLQWFRPILWGLYPKRASCRWSNKEARIWDKYRDLNVNNRTIEFRIFPWIKTIKSLAFRLALIKFFIENDGSTKEKAIESLNNKQEEFIALLDSPYPQLDKKIAVLKRIFKAYEVDELTTWNMIRVAEEYYKNKTA